MKDEIKEILDKLKSDNYPFGIATIDINKLEDYITNLQEKVNQYENPDDMTLMFMWCDEKAKDKIKQLQEENERLRKNQKLTPEQRNHLHLELDEVLEIYKSRNEKALEINQKLQNMYILDSRAIFWLNQQEKVLQGGDKK